MRFRNLISFFALALSSSGAFAEYSQFGTINDIHVQQGAVYLSGIEMESNSTLCPMKNAPMILLEGQQKSPAADSLLSLALVAFSTGKTVKIWANDCVDVHNQPRVQGIKIYGNQ